MDPLRDNDPRLEEWGRDLAVLNAPITLLIDRVEALERERDETRAVARRLAETAIPFVCEGYCDPTDYAVLALRAAVDAFDALPWGTTENSGQRSSDSDCPDSVDKGSR